MGECLSYSAQAKDAAPPTGQRPRPNVGPPGHRANTADRYAEGAPGQAARMTEKSLLPDALLVRISPLSATGPLTRLRPKDPADGINCESRMAVRR